MTNDEQAIRQLVQTWMSATKTGDVDTVLSLMADDVVFLRSGQPPMIGKQTFAAAARAQAAQAVRFDGTSEIREVKVAGDWAFVWTRLTVVATPPAGPAMNLAGHTLSILQKVNGMWVLARDANMLSPVSGG